MMHSWSDDARNVVVRLAFEWWESKRPDGWTVDAHLACPSVNTAVESEQNLARSVAELVKCDRCKVGA